MLRVRKLLLELFCNLCVTPCGLKIQIHYKETGHRNVGTKCWDDSGWVFQVVWLKMAESVLLGVLEEARPLRGSKQIKHSTESESLVGSAAKRLDK